MATGSVKALGKEKETIQGGGYFNIDMQRIGNLRILTMYNVADLQTPISIQLDEKDKPVFNVQVGNWLPVDANLTYGSRYANINTNGVLTTSGDVYRGGWVVVYPANVYV